MWLKTRSNLINLEQVTRILYFPGTKSVWAVFQADDVLIYKGPRAEEVFAGLAVHLGVDGLLDLDEVEHEG